MFNNVLIGCVFGLLAGSALIMNVVVAMTVLFEATYRSNVCYRIIFCMSLLASTVALCFLICAFYTMSEAPIPEGLERVLGAIVNANSYTVVPLDFVLAVNRFFVISNRMLPLERFRVYDILMTLTWLTGLAALGLFVSPECRMSFINYAWDSRLCRAGTLIPKLEFFFLYPFIMSTFLIYLAVLAVIIVKKRSMSTVSAIPATFEWSILGLSGLNFAGGVFLGVFYNLYKGVFPGDPVIAAAVTSVMILLNGVDPLFLLIVNKGLRRHALALFGCKKRHNSTVTPAPTSFKHRLSVQPSET